MKNEIVVVIGMVLFATQAEAAGALTAHGAMVPPSPVESMGSIIDVVVETEESPVRQMAGDIGSAFVSNGKNVIVKSARTEVDGNDLAVDELLKIASYEDESLRIAAVEVLGEIATPRARAALGIVLYRNNMGTVRATAAEQLGALGDGETIFTLALALETERDGEVRDVIAANIERNLEKETVTPGYEVAAQEHTQPAM